MSCVRLALHFIRLQNSGLHGLFLNCPSSQSFLLSVRVAGMSQANLAAVVGGTSNSLRMCIAEKQLGEVLRSPRVKSTSEDLGHLCSTFVPIWDSVCRWSSCTTVQPICTCKEISSMAWLLLQASSSCAIYAFCSSHHAFQLVPDSKFAVIL